MRLLVSWSESADSARSIAGHTAATEFLGYQTTDVETTIGAAKPQINNFLQTIHEQMPGAKGEPVHCSFCSSTLADFRATGRLGCAHCYEAFEGSLRDLLRRVHGNSRHIGRRYVAPLPSELPHVSSATELRDRLKRAIEAEQFELAADLRDKLRGIE